MTIPTGDFLVFRDEQKEQALPRWINRCNQVISLSYLTFKVALSVHTPLVMRNKVNIDNFGRDDDRSNILEKKEKAEVSA